MHYLNVLTAVTQLHSLVGRRPRQTRSATPYNYPSTSNKYQESNKEKNSTASNVQS